MNKLWSYFDSFQSTFFNQKQRDLYPRRAALTVAAFAAAGLLVYWAAPRVAAKAHELERRAA